MILSHSMGYFAFDIIWCFRYNEPLIIKFHHVVTCFGLFYYSFKLSHQHMTVYALGLLEFTNPLVQTRWYLTYHNMTKELIFKIVDRAFIISFFYIRIFVSSYYFYKGLTIPALNWSADDFTFVSFGLLIGYGLSGYMIHFLIDTYRKSKLKEKVEKLT